MAVVTDNFAGGAQNPISTPWANNGVDAVWQRDAGGTASPANITADSEAHYTSSGIGTEQYVQCKVTVTGTAGAGTGTGVVARAAAGAKTYYRIIVDHAGANNVEVARFDAGTYNSLSQFTNAWTDGDTLRAEVTGVGATVTIKVFRNGTQIGANVTDSNANRIVTAGNPGLGYSGVETSTSVDDFEAGDLAAAIFPNVFVSLPLPRRAEGNVLY